MSKDISLDYCKQYYINNKKRICQYDKQYRLEHLEDIKQRKKKYYLDNREKILDRQKQYSKTHPRPEYHRQYFITHKDKCSEYQKQYQKTNQSKEYHKQYIKNNRVKVIEGQRKWRIEHPKEARKIAIRHYNKRERNLKFEPLNEYFEGSEAHHLDKIYIVYIPKEEHRSIYHCLEKGNGMEEINKIAMNYILNIKEEK